VPAPLGASLAAWFAAADSKLLLNELRQAGLACCQEDPSAADVLGQQHADDAADGAAAAAGSAGSAAAGGAPCSAAAAAPRAPPPAAAGGAGPVRADVKPLAGISVCVTGALRNDALGGTRDEVAAAVARLGGDFRAGVTRATTWLVVSALGRRLCAVCAHRACVVLRPVAATATPLPPKHSHTHTTAGGRQRGRQQAARGRQVGHACAQ
jgi:NAD-dependent DNA ligase